MELTKPRPGCTGLSEPPVRCGTETTLLPELPRDLAARRHAEAAGSSPPLSAPAPGRGTARLCRGQLRATTLCHRAACSRIY